MKDGVTDNKAGVKMSSLVSFCFLLYNIVNKAKGEVTWEF